ncbi:MAG: hypothetical protein ACM33T_05975 [Solirubrobacterales bacterium]
MIRASLLCAAAVALGFAAQPAEAAKAGGKEPPKCAAVSFRPIANLANDGTMTAGHYASRFAKIDVIGTVQNGQDSYKLQVNNKDIVPLQGEVPKSTFGCLNSKHVKTPPQAIQGACRGSRLRTVIDSSGKEKLYMLFALQGDDWKLCQAGRPQG